MIPVIWHISDGFWDCAFPKYVLDRAADCVHFVGVNDVEGFDEPLGVVVIPGRHSAEPWGYECVNSAAAHFRKVVFVVIGDEEGIFHADRLEHQNKKVWWFMPAFHPKQHVDRVCINGWPIDGPQMILQARRDNPQRLYDWSFCGQITHCRRVACLDGMQGLPGEGFIVPTPGFTQGVPRAEYYAIMAASRIVPCPSGPCTPDSFRFAEALEAGCIPVADELIQDKMYPRGYWQYVLGEDNPPFPLVSDWSTLPAVVKGLLEGWEEKAELCERWWTNKKQKWIWQMTEDLYGSISR